MAPAAAPVCGADVSAFFAQRFGAGRYPIPRLTVPALVLSTALRLAGRSDVEPQRRYSGARLAARGFAPPRSFAAALEEYATWVAQHARP